MLESKYFKKFQEVKDLDLYADRILVEKVPPFEAKTKSGIIKSVETKDHKNDFSQEAAQFVIAIKVGTGYYNADKNETIPLDIKPGDVLMLPKFGTRWFSQFGPYSGYNSFDIGLTTESEIHFNFGPIENFDAIFKALNA